MKQRLALCALCLLCGLLLSSCTMAANPLAQAEATAMPGVPLELHDVKAASETELEVTLYFRFLDSSMLAAESRVITAGKDESNELAVINALLQGPSAERTELRRVIHGGVSVLSTSVSGNVLFVTLSEAFVNDGLPADWQEQPEYRTEAPIARMLGVQSLVDTLMENFSYQGVQLMIARENAGEANTRLDRSYFLTGQTGPTDPLTRDESLLLTHYNTVALLLKAWSERDYETLYTFTCAYADNESKPVYETFVSVLDAAPALSQFSASPGSVSENGLYAVHGVNLLLLQNGTERALNALPVRLARVNGVWKITYAALQALMLQNP